uniref:Atg6 BARA domain-containing protein n=1 Tax=Globisporangium ultimum (strain ATCC 200006 / CBS 805.95 / DAOM BR144) TaxID=431595 RepID=K3X838_GLOUD
MTSLLPQQLTPIVKNVAPTTLTAMIPPSRSAGVAMEGKSLFTCHQCGALLKFKFNPVSIEEKITRLRSLEFDHPSTYSPVDESMSSAPMGADDNASQDDENEDQSVGGSSPNTPNGGKNSLGSPGGAGASVGDGTSPTPVIAREVVWENQRMVLGSGGKKSAQWAPVAFEAAGLIAAFYSCNRGVLGHSINEVVPARLLNKPHLWVTKEWEIDRTLAHCDDEGWIYETSFENFDPLSGELREHVVRDDAAIENSSSAEKVVRRRRVFRKRRVDGTDLSWFQELLDCSSLLLKKKTPSCHDCEETILHGLEETLQGIVNDREQYETFLAQFLVNHDEESIKYEFDGYEDDPELRAIQEEERLLLEEIESLDLETRQVQSKRQELWSTGKDLEQLVRGTFAEGAFLQHLLGLSRDERQSVGVYSVYASDLLRRLQRYNVFNDVFHIWHDGLFGTINGLRLGRLPSKPVEWQEINAALGQAVLLLAIIAERANFDFIRNKLIPRGSFSRVVSAHNKEYSLYSDGGMFRRRGFNQAMILFLECVDDAGRRAMHEEPSMKFPYKIQRGKINDLPISLGNDEQWTKALKCMLTHLKWLLAWISKRYP